MAWALGRYVSLRAGGTGATGMLAPCATHSDCGPGHACVDLADLVKGRLSTGAMPLVDR
eukprot:COSAG01_NODE_3813_length_5675_cov_25.731970_7_plen_59_part_00